MRSRDEWVQNCKFEIVLICFATICPLVNLYSLVSWKSTHVARNNVCARNMEHFWLVMEKQNINLLYVTADSKVSSHSFPFLPNPPNSFFSCRSPLPYEMLWRMLCSFQFHFDVWNFCIILVSSMILTHFSPMLHLYTPWKCQKSIGFLTFSGGIEMWHWTKMG